MKPLPWVRLAELTPSELERRFGERGVRLLAAHPEAWGLEKRLFRALVAEGLPKGHELAKIAREKREQRMERAARARARVSKMASLIPVLPSHLRAESFEFVYLPVVRPRSAAVRWELRQTGVAQVDLPNAVALGLASAFEEQLIAQLNGKVRRIELCVIALPKNGADTENTQIAHGEPGDLRAALPSSSRKPANSPGSAAEPEAPAETMIAGKQLARARPAWTVESPSADRVPWVNEGVLPRPSYAGCLGPMATLEWSLLSRGDAEFEERVLEHSGATPLDLYTGQSEGAGLKLDSVRTALFRAKDEVSHLVLSEWIGPITRYRTPPRTEAGIFSSLRKGLKWAEWAVISRQRMRSAHGVIEKAREVLEAVCELDLSLLPDDGLARTLRRLWIALQAVRRKEMELTEVSLLWVAAFQDTARNSRYEGAPWGLSALELELVTPLVTAFRELLRAGRESELAAFGERYGRSICLQPKKCSTEHWAALAVAVRGSKWAERLMRVPKTSAEGALPKASRDLSLGMVQREVEAAITLRERLRFLEHELEAELYRALLDVDARLPELEPGLFPGAVFHFEWDELLQTLDLRSQGLSELVEYRRIEFERKAGQVPYFGAARARGMEEILGEAFWRSGTIQAQRLNNPVPTFLRSLGMSEGTLRGLMEEVR